MTQPEINLRMRRTQKLLRDAVIELIEERGFDSLTVGEICERAMISRAAFYRNYKDKYDVVEQIFEEAIHILFNAFSELVTVHNPEVWVKFFEHIAEYERLYRALLGRNGSPWFVHKMRGSLFEIVKEFGRITHSPREDNPVISQTSDEFVTDLVATMFVEAITWWLEHDMPFTPKEMTERCGTLTFAIYRETHNWN